jgi:prepilin-type processing-associated H-X9-DG protein
VADTRSIWNGASIDWIAGDMTRPGQPPGDAYQAGLTPCGTAAGPGVTPDHCAYDNQGTFQTHQGLVNFIFADSHVKAMKLADTAVPNDMWDGGYSLGDRTVLVDYMRTEYK